MVTVSGAPLTVDQGEPLAVRVIVRNIGLLNAPASTLRLRLLSTDVTPPRSKSLKGLVTVPRGARGREGHPRCHAQSR